MKNKLAELCLSFLILYLLACGFAAFVLMGMLLMPIAVITVFVLAIKEMIIRKRKITSDKPFIGEIKQKQTATVRKIVYPETDKKRAA